MSEYNGVLYTAPPPEGYTPDFHRPYEATALIACICVFLPLAVVSSIVRLYTRTRIVRLVALDDYIMLLAMICSVALTGFVLNLLNYGLGKHLYDVPLDWLFPSFLFNNILAAIFFCAATGFAKAAILLFYSRIFPSRTFHAVIYVLVIFTIGYSAASVFVNIFSCNPIAKSWEIKYAKTGSCINRPVFYFAQAGLGIFADFATLVAPLPSLWKLQLPLRQKVGVAALLMTGGFVCIVSIIRLQSLYVLLRSTDLTTATTPALMWCIIELNMSILGGNVPTIKPFLRKYFPGLLGSTSGTGAGHSSNAHDYSSGHSRNRMGSHQLKSFNDATNDSSSPGDSDGGINIGAIGAKGFSKTTVTGSTEPKNGFGDNESEEYIIQRIGEGSERDLERTGAIAAGPLAKGGFGTITRTVEFGYKEDDAIS